jgi:Na+/H+-dicarboxylate symporter
MPIVILLLLAALVATFGFWSTLKAILGAIGVIVLLCLLFVALVAGLLTLLLRR